MAFRKTAVFSHDRKYRYLLHRIWSKDTGVALFIGLNPSTADEVTDDPTVRRCIRFARSWGYGGMVMSNIFAFRSTDPKALYAEKYPIGDWLNDRMIKKEHSRAAITIAAWGVHGEHMGRGRKVAGMLSGLHCLGVTKKGHPRHPLYLRKDSEPQAFIYQSWEGS